MARSMAKSRRKLVEPAERRLGRALRDVRPIENPSNRRNYDFCERDADGLFGVLCDATAAAERRLRYACKAGFSEIRLAGK